jgi:hypothetical protein
MAHTGSWGTPDFGLTELAAKGLSKIISPFTGGGTPMTAQGGSNLMPGGAPSTQLVGAPSSPAPTQNSSQLNYSPAPQVKGANTSVPTGGNNPAPSNNNNNNNSNVDPNQAINDAKRAQEEAARQAAEAKRQAAQRSYEGKVGEANIAKSSASGQYDWIVDTLGSNKKDALDQIALNETEGLNTFGQQEGKTKVQYDTARQEILSTYRDLTREQEKILRGSGNQSSSRRQEASLRLNNLMGKDLSGVSANEADSLAMIGNAITGLKSKTVLAKNQVETETKSKLDKAALDYDTQVKAIDQNLQLSGNEREDAYAQAEVQLAQDTANINSWSTGLKLQAEQTAAKTKEMLDSYIVDMTDSKGLLDTDLNTKKEATNKLLSSAGYTPLVENANVTDPTAGVYQKTVQKYKSKAELDAALASGAIQPLDYSKELATLQNGGGAAPDQNQVLASSQRDPLMSALFA